MLPCDVFPDCPEGNDLRSFASLWTVLDNYPIMLTCFLPPTPWLSMLHSSVPTFPKLLT